MAALAAALAGLLVALAAATAGATTESSDAAALGNLYTSWNSPSQLAGWSASGGDPCGAVWQGITCTGSGVTEIKLAGTGLNGSLGYELSNLYSLKTLDLSNNNIRGSIPYQLPPNLTYLNLATNNFSGNLPYSISNMASIEYLSGSIHAFSSADALIFFVWTMVFFGSCKVQVRKHRRWAVQGRRDLGRAHVDCILSFNQGYNCPLATFGGCRNFSSAT